MDTRGRPLRPARDRRTMVAALQQAMRRVTHVRRPSSYVQPARVKGDGDDSVRLLNRRAFGVPSTGAQSMTTDKEHPEDRRRTPADQELIDAELELNRLRAAKRYDDTDDIETKIYTLQPRSWIGGAIKLRLLCDPAIGLEISEPSEEQMVAARQVLELRRKTRLPSAREVVRSLMTSSQKSAVLSLPPGRPSSQKSPIRSNAKRRWARFSSCWRRRSKS
jgi:hypothetical protein